MRKASRNTLWLCRSTRTRKASRSPASVRSTARASLAAMAWALSMLCCIRFIRQNLAFAVRSRVAPYGSTTWRRQRIKQEGGPYSKVKGKRARCTVPLLVAQGYDGIDLHGTSCGYVAGDECDEGQNHGHTRKSQRISCAHAEKQIGHQAGESGG